MIRYPRLVILMQRSTSLKEIAKRSSNPPTSSKTSRRSIMQAAVTALTLRTPGLSTCRLKAICPWPRPTPQCCRSPFG